MEKGWVSIYSSTELHQIDMIKGLLFDNDINAVEINKKDSSYLFGEVELCVRRESVATAIYLIEKANS